MPALPTAGTKPWWQQLSDFLLVALDVTTGKLLDNAAATATINAQVGAAYTLVLADHGKIVSMNNAGANTVTIPPNSSVAFPVGATITLRQAGAGQTTIAPGAGVTLNSRGAAFKLAGQYAYATLVKVAADTWELSGDISA